jgi:tRNA(Ile)-lysidine synthase
VSGGVDSTALLILAVAHGLRPTVYHVEHGLRDDSRADAVHVARLAAQFGLDFVVHRVELVDGPNLEARARDARRATMPDDVMTGHTLDDQAETVVLRLLRGSAAGLGAMRPGPTHPILALRRSETEAMCRAAEIDWRTDTTNTSPRFLRNRVRHEVVPLLDSLASRDLTPVLARQADLVRADDDLLDTLAADVDPTDAKALAAAPEPLARRAVRRWLRGHRPPHPPDLATIDRVLAVARGEHVACEVGGDLRVERSRSRLRIVTTRTPTAT